MDEVMQNIEEKELKEELIEINNNEIEQTTDNEVDNQISLENISIIASNDVQIKEEVKNVEEPKQESKPENFENEKVFETFDVKNNENKQDFGTKFSTENLALGKDGSLFPRCSKFFNDIFAKLYFINKNETVTGEFLLDTATGVPTDNKSKWESAYALQQLNFGINSNHQKFIQRKIENDKYIYSYDSNADGEFEYEIGFDKDGNAIFDKLINKNPQNNEIVSIYHKSDKELRIQTNQCEIVELTDDKHTIKAGNNVVTIVYNDDGTVNSMECKEETEENNNIKQITENNFSCVVSAEIKENNEQEDDLESLALQINAQENTIDLIEE